MRRKLTPHATPEKTAPANSAKPTPRGNAPADIAAAIADTLALIRAAGHVPGMPATSDTVADVLAGGCRYIYTHLPRVLGAGARPFLDQRPASDPSP